MNVVNTIAGPFDRGRLETLQSALRQATEIDGLDRDQVIKFEGRDLLISFGQYLAEFVEGELKMMESGL